VALLWGYFSARVGVLLVKYIDMRFKTDQEIRVLREGGKRLHTVLMSLLDEVKSGVSSYSVELSAQKRIREVGGTPSFLGYGSESGNPFPAALCISINNEIVHGIPREGKVFHDGDVVTLDIGMWYEGLATDMARTVIVGDASPRVRELVESTKRALDAGIAVISDGVALREYAKAVEAEANRHGFGVVRELVGHGVGHAVHEPPQISNVVSGASRGVFEKNMVVALEPMLTLGGWRVSELGDGWTFITEDGSIAAHFEDTIAITEKGVIVLTR
jgi:methionyl aminopeptidase